MFKQLHVRLTVFFTLITGIIFLFLTSICLLFAESSIKQSNHASFLTKLNAVILHLQEQDNISHQWLNQIQHGEDFKLYLYDNRTPLSYQSYHLSEAERTLVDEAIQQAQNNYDMDIFVPSSQHISTHTEFTFRASNGNEYETSAGIIPNENGYLSFIVLSSHTGLRQQLRFLRLAVIAADVCAILLLAVFVWFFTGRLLVPLSENQKKQMHFIASASHELRTPLSVLLSGLESIAKTTDAEQRAHFIDIMTTEGHRMQHLINDMLLLANADSKSLSIHMEPHQPDELLLHTYEAFEPLARQHDITLTVSLPEDLLPDCCCDWERMTQVFSILTDNALSYTPAGGKIFLSLAYQRHVFEFRFADTGCGVPDEEKQTIFDRFYRADAAHTDKKHFGLGLCIAKEIVSAHSGRIWVEDRIGGGACFVVTLPNQEASKSNTLSRGSPQSNKI
ncbi:MAG: HAMP domain-containing sensor histidine kinase [Eubacteriales bacterium]|nr:HAMP domain-containing sensor histidine kinase [Eubacteriales bacterium]